MSFAFSLIFNKILYVAPVQINLLLMAKISLNAGYNDDDRMIECLIREKDKLVLVSMLLSKKKTFWIASLMIK